MAARPGEELVATLFADIHYYYGPPTAKPPHHRFDKGSYVYLFENPGHRRARVEVANNAGTPEQDAFNGHLDGAHVHYSYKHSTLVTLTVEGSNRSSFGSPPADNQEWHLPTFDPRNENKYMYKLHTIDIYFWVKEDALQFVNGVRRVLPQPQVTVQDEPVAPPPHQHDMSPVVQRLENVAIADPSYQQGQTRNSQTTSLPPAPLSRSSTGNFPGPPIAPVSRSSTNTFPGPPISATPQSMEASNFVPLAYNPAAPAAPETIQHREKTPPPEDGAGNPLVAAAAADQGQQFGAPYQHHGGFSGPPQPQQANYFPGPPAAHTPPSQFSQHPPPSAGFQSSFGQPPPPSAGLQSPYAQHFQNSFAAPPTAPSTSSPYAQPPSAVASAPPPPSFHQPTPPASNTPHIPVTQQYAQYPMSPGLSSPGLSSPGITSPGIYSPMNPSFGSSPQAPSAPPPASAPPPPGGFSQYSYQNQPDHLSNTRPHQTDYSIHQQVYRPTEVEATKPQKAPKPPGGKLEERAGRLEKGASSLFKRLEKKIG